jgi:hypothetical protein
MKNQKKKLWDSYLISSKLGNFLGHKKKMSSTSKNARISEKNMGEKSILVIF